MFTSHCNSETAMFMFMSKSRLDFRSRTAPAAPTLGTSAQIRTSR